MNQPVSLVAVRKLDSSSLPFVADVQRHVTNKSLEYQDLFVFRYMSEVVSYFVLLGQLHEQRALLLFLFPLDS